MEGTTLRHIFSPSTEIAPLIRPDLEDIDLTGNKLQVMPDLSSVTNLLSVCLRQNYLTVLSGFPSPCPSLESLDAYDNRLPPDGVACLAHMPNLTYLDLSFNELRCVDPVDGLVHLEELYLIQNKITEISPVIGRLTQLSLLELGSNRIRELANLQCLTQLTKLYLGRNKITEIKGLDTLTNLKCLSLQHNRLTKIENLDKLTQLTELYLANNGITKIENLEALTRLRILDLSHNMLEHLEGLETLQDLEDFWCTSNRLGSFDELDALVPLPRLETFYIEHNPVAREVDYRMTVLCRLPTLIQIDADLVTEKEKAEMRVLLAQET